MKLDPYAPSSEIPILTGQELIDEIAFYKQTADENGEPYDPEWNQWLAEDALGQLAAYQGVIHG